MMFPYLETALSFALVMLVASLMVNVVVRVLYTLRGARSQGVVSMLRQLHRGFCRERGIELGDGRRAAEDAFIDDILGSETLHDAADWDQLEAAEAKEIARAKALRDQADAERRSAADKERLIAQADAIVAKAHRTRMDELRRQVDWVKLGDLLAIIRSRSTDYETTQGGRTVRVDDVKVMPAAWFPGNPTQRYAPPTRAQRVLFGVDAAPDVINARDFHDYCMRWFPTVEAGASKRFGDDQRKTARSVAGLVVVLLNLDAIHLAYDLYNNRALSDQLVSRVGDVVDMAKKLGDGPAPGAPGEDLGQLRAQLEKTAALLTIQRVPIGWQDSYISKRWCAYHDDCTDETVQKPTTKALFYDVCLWLFGLITSWMLLSLGAPFWVSTIEKITGLANLLSGKKVDDHADEESTWTTEGGGQAASYRGVATPHAGADAAGGGGGGSGGGGGGGGSGGGGGGGGAGGGGGGGGGGGAGDPDTAGDEPDLPGGGGERSTGGGSGSGSGGGGGGGGGGGSGGGGTSAGAPAPRPAPPPQSQAAPDAPPSTDASPSDSLL